MAPVTLLAFCLSVYACGVYLTHAFPCQPVGAWALVAGVAIGFVALVRLTLSAFRRRSVWQAFGATALAVVLVAMFLLIGVLTLPGCSGV